jgi:hypothetical protein
LTEVVSYFFYVTWVNVFATFMELAVVSLRAQVKLVVVDLIDIRIYVVENIIYIGYRMSANER